MDVLSDLLDALRSHAYVELHATFCDRWQVDMGTEPMASFHVVSRGECWLHLPEGPPVALHPHDLVFVPRNSPHVVAHSVERPTRDTPVNRPAERVAGPSTTLLCGRVEFEQDDWNPLIEALPAYIVLPIEQYGSTTLGSMSKALIAEAERGATGSRVVLDRLADVLFVEIVRLHVSKNNTSSFLAAIEDPRIGEALSQFHAGVDRHWSIESLAGVSGMSRSAFAARFQDLVGIAPMQYVRRWRMQLGRRLLVTISQPIVKIAESCG